MKRDLGIIEKRKKIWDIMGYVYRTPNYLYKNHQLTCNCGQCRYSNFIKHYERKVERIVAKLNLKKELLNKE